MKATAIEAIERAEKNLIEARQEDRNGGVNATAYIEIAEQHLVRAKELIGGIEEVAPETTPVETEEPPIEPQPEPPTPEEQTAPVESGPEQQPEFDDEALFEKESEPTGDAKPEEATEEGEEEPAEQSAE